MRRIERHASGPVLTAGIVLFAALISAPAADAGTWRGDVSHKGVPAAGATVTICDQPTTTDNSGSFRFDVQNDDQGCSVIVRYDGRDSAPVKTNRRPYLSLSLRSSSNGWVIQVD